MLNNGEPVEYRYPGSPSNESQMPGPPGGDGLHQPVLLLLEWRGVTEWTLESHLSPEDHIKMRVLVTWLGFS